MTESSADNKFLDLNGLKLFVDRELMSDGDIDAIIKNRWELGEYNLVGKVIDPGDRVIEIGTCSGYISMAIAKKIGPENLMTFEANPAPLRIAEINFRANNLKIQFRNTLLQNKLIYDNQKRKADFFVNSAIVSSSALAGHGSRISVETSCLEDEIIKFKANALVLDIEGSEVDLLIGSDLSLINKIAMETHYRKAGRKQTNKMINYILRQGFSIDLEVSKHEVVYLYRD